MSVDKDHIFHPGAGDQYPSQAKRLKGGWSRWIEIFSAYGIPVPSRRPPLWRRLWTYFWTAIAGYAWWVRDFAEDRVRACLRKSHKNDGNTVGWGETEDWAKITINPMGPFPPL